jgi:hypothetical protein
MLATHLPICRPAVVFLQHLATMKALFVLLGLLLAQHLVTLQVPPASFGRCAESY